MGFFTLRKDLSGIFILSCRTKCTSNSLSTSSTMPIR